MKDQIHKNGAKKRGKKLIHFYVICKAIWQAGLFLFLCINRINGLWLPFIKKVFGKRVTLETGVVNLSKVDGLDQTPSKIFSVDTQLYIDLTFRNNNHVIVCL